LKRIPWNIPRELNQAFLPRKWKEILGKQKIFLKGTSCGWETWSSTTLRTGAYERNGSRETVEKVPQPRGKEVRMIMMTLLHRGWLGRPPPEREPPSAMHASRKDSQRWSSTTRSKGERSSCDHDDTTSEETGLEDPYPKDTPFATHGSRE
jgi:hypothetical protein